MRYTFKIVIIGFVTMFTSCSTMKQAISKNQKNTNKYITNLLKNNDNVFYLYSTYSTFSTVWTYRSDSIEIYRLAKGKLISKEIYKNTGIKSFQIPTIKDLNSDIDKCGLVLDGDIIGFEFDKNKPEKNHNQITTDIKCFKAQKYKSDFLNKLVEDITIYKMWNIE